MHVAYIGNQIISYREAPYIRINGVKYLETSELVDGYSYIEDNELKRPPQSEIDEIESNRIIEAQKSRILSFYDEYDLINNANFDDIQAFRLVLTSVNNENTDLDELEKSILIEKIDSQDDLSQKTLEELWDIYNQIFLIP